MKTGVRRGFRRVVAMLMTMLVMFNTLPSRTYADEINSVASEEAIGATFATQAQPEDDGAVLESAQQTTDETNAPSFVENDAPVINDTQPQNNENDPITVDQSGTDTNPTDDPLTTEPTDDIPITTGDDPATSDETLPVASRTYVFTVDKVEVDRQTVVNGDALTQPETPASYTEKDDAGKSHTYVFDAWTDNATGLPIAFGTINDIPAEPAGAEYFVFASAQFKEQAADYPAQTFTGRMGYLDVTVVADEGAFPENTEMKLSAVNKQKAIAAAQDAIDKDPGRDEEVVDAIAVDITFLDADGGELQPAKENSVHVILTALRELKGDAQDVAHIENLTDPWTETVTTLLETHEVDINATVREDAQGNTTSANVTASFDAEHFSIYGIIGTENGMPRRTYVFFVDSSGDGKFTYKRASDGAVVTVTGNEAATIVTDTGEQTVTGNPKFDADKDTADGSTVTIGENTYQLDTVIQTQIIKSGDRLNEPPVPKIDENDIYFVRWTHITLPDYVGRTVNFETIPRITEDRTVYCIATFDTEYMVRFFEPGSTTEVAEIRKIDVSDSAQDVIDLSEIELALTDQQQLTGWRTSSESVTLRIGEEDRWQFDVNEKIPEIAIDRDLNLYPVIISIRKVQFKGNGDGASFTAPIIVAPDADRTLADYDGNGTSVEDPVRPGYTFTGWYREAACTNLFAAPSGGTTQTKIVSGPTLILYAGWTANTDTEYEVMIWKEVMDANGNPYEDSWTPEDHPEKYARISRKVYEGKTGDRVTLAQLNAAVEDADDNDSVDFESDYYEIVTDLSALANSRTIEGDGSTVYNIYYNSKIYKFRFDLGWSYRNRSTAKMIDIQFSAGDKTFQSSVTNSTNGLISMTGSDNTVIYDYINTGDNAYQGANTDYGRGNRGKVIAEELLESSTGQVFVGYYTYSGGNAGTYRFYRYYQFSAKIGQDISELWPTNLTYPSNANIAFVGYQYNPIPWGGTISDSTGTGKLQSTSRHNLEPELIYTQNDVPQALTRYMDKFSGTGSSVTVTTEYYFENLSNTNAVLDTSNSTKSEAFSATWKSDPGARVGDKAIEGYTPYTEKNEAASATLAAEGTVYQFFYFRNRHAINFHNRTENASASVSDIKYEMPLNNVSMGDGTAIKDYTPEKPAGLPDYYSFQGWYLSRDYETKFDFDITMPNADITLWAYWKPEDFTVTFESNGGSEVADRTVAGGQLLTDIPSDPTRGNYTFAGWYDENNVQVDFENRVIESDITVYAKWIGGATYTVKYTDEYQGHQVPEDTNTYHFGAHILLPYPPGEATGMFHGWRLANATGDDAYVTYQPGDTYLFNDLAMANSNREIVFTAWHGESLPAEVYISYNSNYPAASGKDSTTVRDTIVRGNNETVAENATWGAAWTTAQAESQGFELDGYEIKSWNTASDGNGTKIAVGQTGIFADNKILNAEEELNVLYAQWEAKPADYKVQTYIKQIEGELYPLDSSLTDSAPVDSQVIFTSETRAGLKLDIDTTVNKITELTGKGYELSYTTDLTDTNNPKITITGTVAADGKLEIDFYYTRKSYPVIYTMRGAAPDGWGTVPAAATCVYGDEVTIEDGPAAVAGYTLTKWHTTGSDVVYVTGSTDTFYMPARQVEIVAQYTANSDTKYWVNHLLADTDDEYPSYSASDAAVANYHYTLTGTTGTNSTAYPHTGDFAGYELDIDRTLSGFTMDNADAAKYVNSTTGQIATVTKSGDEITDIIAISGTITGDEQMTINYYYKRLSYTISYALEGGTTPDGFEAPQTVTKKTGDVFYASELGIGTGPDISDYQGYTVTQNWHFKTLQAADSTTGKYIMPAENRVLYATITADSDTKYWVNHLLENLASDGGGYPSYGTEDQERRSYHYTATGTTMENGRAVPHTAEFPGFELDIAKTLEGFIVDPSDETRYVNEATGQVAVVTKEAGEITGITDITGTITGDEQMTINFYYNRLSYKMSYEYEPPVPVGADALPGETAYQYGQTVTLNAGPANVTTNDGKTYTAVKWHTTGSDIEYLTGSTTTFKMPARAVKAYASFTLTGGIQYEVRHFLENLDGATYQTAVDDTRSNDTDVEVSAHSRTADFPGYILDVEKTLDGFSPESGVTFGQPGTYTKTITVNNNQETITAVLTGTGNAAYIEKKHTLKGEDDEQISFDFYYKRRTYKITYEIESTVKPEGYTAPTAEYTFTYGETITAEKVAEMKIETEPADTYAGYTVTETWHFKTLAANADGTYTMPSRDLKLYASFTANSDTKYWINHLLQGTNDAYPSYAPTDAEARPYHYTGEGTTLGNGDARPHTGEFEGYELDMDKTLEGFVAADGTTPFNSSTGNAGTYTKGSGANKVTAEVTGTAGKLDISKLTGVIAADGAMSLNFYYKRQSYTIRYEIESTVRPSGYTAPTATHTFKYGDTITAEKVSEMKIGTEPANTYAGYTVTEHWHFKTLTDNGDGTYTMPARNLTLYASFTADSDTRYWINHLLENVDGTYPSYTASQAENRPYHYTAQGTTLGDGEAIPHTEEFAGFELNVVKTLEGFTKDSVTVSSTTSLNDITAGTYTKTYTYQDAANTSQTLTMTATVTGSGESATISRISGQIAPDDSMVINYYYSRKTHKVEYKWETTPPAGAQKPDDQAGVAFGSTYAINTSKSDSTLKVGEKTYTLVQWHTNGTDIEYVNGSATSFIMPDRDVTIYAAYVLTDGISYKIEHYQINTDNTNYPATPFAERSQNAAAGDEIAAYSREDQYPGFVLDVDKTLNGFAEVSGEAGTYTKEITFTAGGESKTATIKAVLTGTGDERHIDFSHTLASEDDGQITFRFYYKRLSYSISYAVESEVQPEGFTLPVTDKTYVTGAAISAADVSALKIGTDPKTTDYPGYTVTETWHFKTISENDDGTYTMPARNLTLYASFSRNTDTKYWVNHLLQNVTDDDYPAYAVDASADGAKRYYYTGTTLEDGEARPHADEFEGYQLNLTKTLDGFKLNGNAFDGRTVGEYTKTVTFKNGITGTLKATVGTDDNGALTVSKISGPIAADGSMNISFYYDRERYAVKYELDGGVTPDGFVYPADVTSYRYGDELNKTTLQIGTSPEAAQYPGYTIAAWHFKSLEADDNEKYHMPARDVTLYATFTPNTVEYHIHHRLQNESGTDYPLDAHDTDSLHFYTQNGATGDTGTAVSRTWEGFTLNVIRTLQDFKDADGHTVGDDITDNSDIETGVTYTGAYTDSNSRAHTISAVMDASGILHLSGEIAGNESLALEFFYDRDSYQVTYEYEGKAPSNAPALPAASKVKYGTSFVIPDGPADLTGFTKDGWHTIYLKNSDGKVYRGDNTEGGNTFVMPAHDIRLVASYEAQSGVAYKVEYYRQNYQAEVTDPKKYTYTIVNDDTLTLTGTADERVTAPAKNYAGYSLTTIEQSDNDDGSVYSIPSAEHLSADGDTVLRLYYNRVKVPVTYRLDENAPQWMKDKLDESSTSYDAALAGKFAQAEYPYDEEGTHKVTLPFTDEDVQASGYTFSISATGTSLTEKTGAAKETDKEFIVGLDPVVITVGYTPNHDTSYKVDYYLQNIDGSYPSTPEPEIIDTARTSQVIDIEPQEFDGFTLSYYDQFAIRNTGGMDVVTKILDHMDSSRTGWNDGEVHLTVEDGSKIDYYYTRNSYTLKYTLTGTMPAGAKLTFPDGTTQTVTAGDGPTDVYTATLKYGQDAGGIAVSVPGYSFSGWSLTGDTSGVTLDADGSFEVPAHDVTLTGFITVNNDTSYTVEHYFQIMDVDGDILDDYEIDDTLTDTTGKGVTGEEIAVDGKVKTASGFRYAQDKTDWKSSALTNYTLQSTQPAVIAGDGSTVVRLYYNRQTYSYEYKITAQPKDNEQTAPTGGTDIAAGKKLELTPAPDVAGYTFEGWTASANGSAVAVTTDAVTEDQTVIMPAGDLILSGKYVPDKDTAYTIEYYTKASSGDTYPTTPVYKESYKGTTDTTVQVTKTGMGGTADKVLKAELAGYEWDENESSNETGPIAIKGDGSTVLKLYFTKKKIGDSGEYEHGAGTIITDVDIKPGAPVSNVTGLDKDKALDELTDTEKTEIYETSGDSAKIWLEIEPKTESAVPSEDKTLIITQAELNDAGNATKDKGYPAGISYMDISLHKQVTHNGTQQSPVTLDYFGDKENSGTVEPWDQKEVTVTVTVPQDIINHPLQSGYQREYAVFRVHEYKGEVTGKNGKLAEKLAGWTTGTTLNFNTGLFCTYALVWRDVPVPASPGAGSGGGDGGGSGSDDSPTSSTPTSTSPTATSTATNSSIAGVGSTIVNPRTAVRTSGTGATDVDARGGKTGEEFNLPYHLFVMCTAFVVMMMQAFGYRQIVTVADEYERRKRHKRSVLDEMTRAEEEKEQQG